MEASRPHSAHPLPLLVAIALGFGFGLGWLGSPAVEVVRPSTPEEQFRAAVRTSSLLARVQLLGISLDPSSPIRFQRAREAFEGQLPLLEATELRMFGQAFVRIDPKEAFRKVLSWDEESKSRVAAKAVIEAWAVRDPRSASIAASGIQEPILAEHLETSLIFGWARSGEPGVVDRLVGQAPGKARSKMTNVLVGIRYQTLGEVGLLTWADALPSKDPEWKLTAQQHAARHVAWQAPKIALQWLVDAPDRSGSESAALYEAIAMGWARADPTAAIEWIDRWPANLDTTGILEKIFRRWHRQDPPGMKLWRQDHPGYVLGNRSP